MPPILRRLVYLPWAAAVALHSLSRQDPELPKRVFGAEHRNCRSVPKSRTDLEVIGGQIVDDPGRYPFLAWIGDKDGTGKAQFCGGSLIHPRVVMTAAHCVYRSVKKNANVYVRLGLTDFAKDKGVERDVVNWRVNRFYNATEVTNDIALLLLDRNVTDEEAQPVALADGSEPVDGEPNATVTGWGSTDEACENYGTKLRDAQVPIGRRGPLCKTPGSKALPFHDMDSRKQLCAGNYETSDMKYPGCGDSGGPLLIWNKYSESYIQVGFVSWSYGVPYPDVFTRVSAYRWWIDSMVQEILEAGEHPYVTHIKDQKREARKGHKSAERDGSPKEPDGEETEEAKTGP